ncbi:TVP38/TMEM64 family protein [Maridesulfovibrio zosterae]|uniref:TVP38/TMEM64 family protein n=1 Tax=Maridesulfovibrio zosterae TaxID=82171 RepID=UPI000418BFBA|nr:VTT domain-containing protein [Maridesulfovibrio zosterae]
MSALADWVDARGNFAPLFFMLINIAGMIFVLPQTIFVVVAGVLFGAVKGTAICLVSMAVGSSISFFMGRFVFKRFILRKFGKDPNFIKLEVLSHRHPLKVLALSRIVPVVPYSVANYLWSITKVRFFPFLMMSILCIIPETVFLATGGHILSAGVVKGTLNWKFLAVLVSAGALIFFLVKAVRKGLDDEQL